jgi:hypothetical protein
MSSRYVSWIRGPPDGTATRRGSPAPPRAEQRLHLSLAGRQPHRPVVGLSRPVELVDDLLHQTAGQPMDVAVIPNHEEVEDMAHRLRLLLHRQPRQPQLLALMRQEPVRILRHSRPHRTLQNRMNSNSADRSCAIVLSAQPAPTAASRYWSSSSCSKSTRSWPVVRRRGASGDRTTADSRSPKPTANHQYWQPVRNPDQVSNIAVLAVLLPVPAAAVAASAIRDLRPPPEPVPAPTRCIEFSGGDNRCPGG